MKSFIQDSVYPDMYDVYSHSMVLVVYSTHRLSEGKIVEPCIEGK